MCHSNPPKPHERRGAQRWPLDLRRARPRQLWAAETRCPLGARGLADGRARLGRGRLGQAPLGARLAGTGSQQAWPSRPRPAASVLIPLPPSLPLGRRRLLHGGRWQREGSSGPWGRWGGKEPGSNRPNKGEHTGKLLGTRTNFPVTPRRISLPLQNAVPPGRPAPRPRPALGAWEEPSRWRMGGAERGRAGAWAGPSAARRRWAGPNAAESEWAGPNAAEWSLGGAERGREGKSGAECGPEGCAGSNAAGWGGRCPPRKAAWRRSQLAQRKRRCYQSCRRDFPRPRTALLEEECLRFDSFLWIPQGYMPIFL